MVDKKLKAHILCSLDDILVKKLYFPKPIQKFPINQKFLTPQTTHTISKHFIYIVMF